jgi:dihydrofolate reductase
MKTMLWATLTANGNYARNDPAHPPRPEALADFAAQATAAGNFIVGRRTFESFQAQSRPPRVDASVAPSPFASTTIVVVSSTLRVPGVLSASTARGALELLAEHGHVTALIAGGEQLHNAFLAEDLVDELVLNVAPVLEDDGFKIALPRGQYRKLSLIETKPLGGGVIQLRYDLRAG